VVRVKDPYGRIRYFLFQVRSQLYLRCRVDPVPDPLLLRKCGSAGNGTRTSGSVARNSDHLSACMAPWLEPASPSLLVMFYANGKKACQDLLTVGKRVRIWEIVGCD
jgi:hypothetical protein